jgi:hypothetical protein
VGKPSEALGLLAVTAFLALFLAFAKTVKDKRKSAASGVPFKFARPFLRNWLVWTAYLAAFPALFIALYFAGMYMTAWRPTF